MDWIRAKIGKARMADLEPHHVAAMMDMKGGATSANRRHKELSELYDYARRRIGINGTSPTEQIDRRKVKSDGSHTWTEEQVQQFRAHHPTRCLA